MRAAATAARRRDSGPQRATYQDVLDAPPHRVAEIVDGVLHTNPRPAMPHALATSSLGHNLSGPFQFGRGGPEVCRVGHAASYPTVGRVPCASPAGFFRVASRANPTHSVGRLAWPSSTPRKRWVLTRVRVDTLDSRL